MFRFNKLDNMRKANYNEWEDEKILKKLKQTDLSFLFSYSELCELFNSKKTNCYNSKQKQFEQWRRFCDIELVGKKYKLSNLKVIPEPQINKSKFNKTIANLLYLYMYLHPDLEKENGRGVFSYPELYKVLGYNNENMQEKNDIYQEIVYEYSGVFNDFNKDFYSYVNQQIKRALSKLEDQKIIERVSVIRFLTDKGWEQISDGENSYNIFALLEAENSALHILSKKFYERRLNKYLKQKDLNDYEDWFKPKYYDLTMNLVICNNLYQEFLEISCGELSKILDRQIYSYRTYNDIYTEKNFLGVKLTKELGEEVVKTAEELYKKEQLIINDYMVKRMQNRAVQNGEKFKKLAFSIDCYRQISSDKEHYLESYDGDTNSYKNVLNTINKKNIEPTPDNFEAEYIEIFKDITEKLIKIYPDKFYGEGE